ncbi:MAG: cytochrome c [Alphaproteobacteria bacterium]
MLTKRLLTIAILGAAAIIGFVVYVASPVEQAGANIALTPNDPSVVALGKQVYTQNCASCHGANLEGQANWRQRDPNGYLPAPPHDETGHTWHHPDAYLFVMTKYGIEKMIGKAYPNNMPAYEGKLTDEEIIAALSFIKSTWPKHIQQKHDAITAQSSQ